MKLGLIFGILLIAGSLGAETPLKWNRILPTETVQLRDPRAISVSPEGLVYVADAGHHRVVAVDTAGRIVAETGGFGDAHGQFRWPRAVIADRGNAVWVLDYGNRRIERFSRSLEYQGTFTITVPGDNTPHQPEMIAISPQTDIYVYDRDGGRLVRYDPLFRPQAEIGSGSGLQFVSAIATMTFVSGQGLFWWERGGGEIRHADALLNPALSLALKTSPEDLRLAAADSCLLYAGAQGVLSRCAISASTDTLLDAAALTGMGVTHLAGLATAPDQVLYLLDGGSASLIRVNLLRE